MSKYAVIKIGPFQYNVEEGKEYEVPKFQAEEGKKMSIDSVLLVADEKGVKLGKPVVENAKVELEILEQAKGEKVQSKVYKAKSRYRKTRGFRKRVTKFKVVKITA